MDSPLVHVWIIVNPISGHGRGAVLRRRIEKALNKSCSMAITRARTASELLHHTTAEKTLKEDEEKQEELLLEEEEEEEYGDLNGSESAFTEFEWKGAGLCVDIISTEANIRGREIAEYITRHVVTAKLRRCMRNAEERKIRTTTDSTTTTMNGNTTTSHTNTSNTVTTIEASVYGEEEEEDVLHVFAAMGGDGSLSDVVNGMCFGTISTFRELLPSLLQHKLEEKEEEENNNNNNHDCYSRRYYWQSLEDKSILRHFLPPLVYICAGTGADFSRLKLSCGDEKDFLSVVRGIYEELISLSPSQPVSEVDVGVIHLNGGRGDYLNMNNEEEGGRGSRNPRHSIYSKKSSKSKRELSGFKVYDVDVGRVNFPRSGRHYFFINECSCGISCDVIEKSNKYRRKRLLSMAGGTVMFALASVASIVQMKPKPFRLLPLPAVVDIPSNSQIPRCVNGTLLHPHNKTASVAFQGVKEDLAWLHNHKGNAILPETEPLRYGANYYLYNVKEDKSEPTQNNNHEDYVSAIDPTRNPFYAEHNSRDAKKPSAILNAISNSNAHNGWICFPSSTLVFGNGRWFGGGLQVAPHANPTDGLLSVTNWVVRTSRFLSHIPSIYTGKHTHWPNTTTWNTSRSIVDVDTRSCNYSPSDRTTNALSLSSSSSQKLQGEALMMCLETDGELREELPCIIEMCGIVTLLVPIRSEKRRETWSRKSNEKAE